MRVSPAHFALAAIPFFMFWIGRRIGRDDVPELRLRETHDETPSPTRAPSLSPTFVDYATEVWLSSERTESNFTHARAVALCSIDAPAHCREIVPLLAFGGVDPVDLPVLTSLQADVAVSHHAGVVAHDVAALFRDQINLDDMFWSGVHPNGRRKSPEALGEFDCSGWTGVGEGIVGWTTFSDDVVACRGAHRIPCACSFAL